MIEEEGTELLRGRSQKGGVVNLQEIIHLVSDIRVPLSILDTGITSNERILGTEDKVVVHLKREVISLGLTCPPCGLSTSQNTIYRIPVQHLCTMYQNIIFVYLQQL